MQIDRKILSRAITQYGCDAQIKMIIEECSELIQALAKGFRKDNIENIIDEVADVRIMIEQACIIFGEQAVKERVNFKVQRLNKRLDKNTY